MLIKNARIYGQDLKDIRIQNGKIVEISNGLNDDEILDVKELTLLPSFIDLNVRIKDDNFSIDNLNSLEKDCLESGISCIMLRDSMNFNEDIFEMFLEKLKTMKLKIFTSVNVIDKEDKLKNLAILSNKGAIAYELLSSNNANILRNSMQYASTKDLSIFISCYDKDFDDNGLMNDSYTSFDLGLIGMSKVCEFSEVAKIKQIAKFYGVRVIYDLLSIKESFDLLNSDDLTQVSIHNILKDDSFCDDYNTFAKLMPPLRSKDDIDYLKYALKNNKITFLSSAHSPVSLKYKDLSFDDALFGIDSIKEYISICNTFLINNNLLTWKELCDYTSFHQAKFLGLNSGKIEVGMDANMIIFDENAKNKSNLNSLYKNDELYGNIKHHILNGELIF